MSCRVFLCSVVLLCIKCVRLSSVDYFPQSETEDIDVIWEAKVPYPSNNQRKFGGIVLKCLCVAITAVVGATAKFVLEKIFEDDGEKPSCEDGCRPTDIQTSCEDEEDMCEVRTNINGKEYSTTISKKDAESRGLLPPKTGDRKLLQQDDQEECPCGYAIVPDPEEGP